MIIAFTKEFIKRYKKLGSDTQKQVDKQLKFLQNDTSHPSLNLKKMGGYEIYEVRVSKGYRMRFTKEKGRIVMLTVGQHDVGLGKK